ncbi:MAG TPA: dihydrolipoyllysine-residue acetyltransferase [Spongiibacteraceae bacterium]|nr:dihydrolipoyllysine-residue acetyltransferase [Spongiibacteraceae bacterium]
MTTETINVPDIGGSEDVEVIEVCVAVGDTIAKEDSLVVLESDKASMEVPAPKAGKVTALKLKVGDKVSQGSAILELEVEGESAAKTDAGEKSQAPADKQADKKSSPETKTETTASKEAETKAAGAKEKPGKAASGTTERRTISVPDIGGEEPVDVIEICVSEGQEIAEGDSLIVLESDKASMEVPSPAAGKVLSLLIKVGGKATEGTPIIELEVRADKAAEPDSADDARSAPASPAPQSAVPAPVALPPRSPSLEAPVTTDEVYAGPAVRKLAREFGIDLARVPGHGPRGRILKEDVHQYVRDLVEKRGASVTAGAGILPVPEVDFAAFGEIDVQPMSKLHRLTATNMHRSWLNVPHVTQFDEVDISELEDFRQAMKQEAEARKVKLTPLPFLLKACAAALKANPKLNASLHADGEQVVFKRYVHIGIAVDTPAGLVVPVLRDVDKKGLFELAEETQLLAQKAKDRKLRPDDMQGGCFTISSLGGIGGQGFTPIVNTPEVAILGVSRLSVKPHWDGKQFVPRKMLPLALSYDHRAVNGVDGGRFLTDVGALLTDVRRLLL